VSVAATTATLVEAPPQPPADPGARVAGGLALVSTGTSGRSVSGPTNHGLTKAPRYVRACVNSPYPDAPWHLAFWPKGAPQEATLKAACCGSWRCEGACARYRASVDFARITEALEPYDADDLTYGVMTLDRNGTYSGDAWSDSTTGYRGLTTMSRKFLKRLNRWLVSLGLDPVASRWVGVAEAHRSGWPHMNLILVSKGLAAMLRAERDEMLANGATETQAKLARGEMLGHVVGSGWGPRSFIEPARSKGALAGYLVKLAGELDKPGDAESRGRMVGEVAKLTQIPLNSPKGFRRLRSGKGFLPPRRKSGNTGAMFTAAGRALGVPHLFDSHPDLDERKLRRERAQEVAQAVDALASDGSLPAPVSVLVGEPVDVPVLLDPGVHRHAVGFGGKTNSGP